MKAINCKELVGQKNDGDREESRELAQDAGRRTDLAELVAQEERRDAVLSILIQNTFHAVTVVEHSDIRVSMWIERGRMLRASVTLEREADNAEWMAMIALALTNLAQNLGVLSMDEEIGFEMADLEDERFWKVTKFPSVDFAEAEELMGEEDVIVSSEMEVLPEGEEIMIVEMPERGNSQAWNDMIERIGRRVFG